MAKTVTLLPLETFRERIGFDPWHFWQWSDANGLLVTSSCNPVLLERQSQDHDRAGREDIRQAIAQAENMFAEYTSWYPGPKYFVNEKIQWPRLADHRMIRRYAADADWRWLNMETRWKWIQAVGVRALTAIATNTPVVLSDGDGDGYPDVATIGPIVMASPVTDAREIAVYFSSADRFGTDTTLNTDQWKIDPIDVGISGANLTIRLRPWMLARPVLYEGVRPQPLDPATLSNFVTTLDVYRRYTDTNGQTTSTSQATIIWETRPIHGWWCACLSCASNPYSGSPYDPASVAQAVARVGIRDSEKGLLTPAEAVYNSADGTWASTTSLGCDEPDRVVVRYLAGYPLDDFGHMDSRMQEIVTFLAAAELWRPVCGCSAATRALDFLQFDLSKIGNQQELYDVSERVNRNVFGTRRGHVKAYQRLNMEEIWGGTAVG